jgi:DNA-binding transcriptional LysR family regulator
VSQTSLQRAARDLERTLRTPIYVQTASGIMAAPNAVEFARKMKLAQREIDWGIEEIDSARGNTGGELVIGALLLSGSVVLASVISEIANTYPAAEVRILNGNADDVLRYLRNGDVDMVIGLLQNPESTELVHEVLAVTPYVVVGRHDHPLMKQQHVSPADLARCEWVVGTPGSHRRIQFEKMFADQQRPSTHVATCSLPIIRMLLAHSDRLTLLTSYELMYEEDALTSLPTQMSEPAPSIGLTMRQNWLPTQLQSSVIQLIKQRVVGSLSPLRELRRIAQGAGPRKTAQAPKSAKASASNT